ncbi:MAG: hypothetical protein WD294_16855 [Phycisphaeraceae bacterium]
MKTATNTHCAKDSPDADSFVGALVYQMRDLDGKLLNIMSVPFLRRAIGDAGGDGPHPPRRIASREGEREEGGVRTAAVRTMRPRGRR